MDIGYLIDTNVGPYDGPRPDGPTVARSMDAFIAEGELAERVGFHALHVPERHMRTECHFPAPFLLLSALAARTSHVRLCTHTLVATLYHPMQIAENAAVIDAMSRGRMVLTVAMGYHDDYWRLYGMTRKGRRDRFIETVQIIRKAFAGERFSFNGQHFKLDNVQLTPLPYRPGNPELWLGGHFDRAIERAGMWGDGWCGDIFPIDPGQWSHRMELYRGTAKKHGSRQKVVILRDAWVARTREEAMRVFGQMHAEEHRFYYRWGIFPPSADFPNEQSITAESLAPHCIVGSPDDCVQNLRRYRDEFGVDECVVRFRVPLGPDFAATRDALQLFGEEVIPRV